jgi:hypothetical protein
MTMDLHQFDEEIDAKLSAASSALARHLNRRQMLSRVVKASAAGVAGLAMGTLTGVSAEAAVHTYHCGNWFGTGCRGCSPHCGGCPNFGCPHGCSQCHAGNCSVCEYSSGSWVAQSGLGRYGNGFRLCYDCNCGSCRVCTCLSAVICGQCATAEDVRDATLQVAAAG